MMEVTVGDGDDGGKSLSSLLFGGWRWSPKMEMDRTVERAGGDDRGKPLSSLLLCGWHVVERMRKKMLPGLLLALTKDEQPLFQVNSTTRAMAKLCWLLR